MLATNRRFMERQADGATTCSRLTMPACTRHPARIPLLHNRLQVAATAVRTRFAPGPSGVKIKFRLDLVKFW